MKLKNKIREEARRKRGEKQVKNLMIAFTAITAVLVILLWAYYAMV